MGEKAELKQVFQVCVVVKDIRFAFYIFFFPLRISPPKTSE